MPGSYSYSGTKKQKREEVESDGISYDGLDQDYQRRRIMTDPRPPLKDGSGRTVEMVDFNEIADSTQWGTKLLFDGLDVANISALVGLATTYGTEEDDVVPTGTATSQDDDEGDGGDDNDNDLGGEDHPATYQDPQRHNPLRQIPYGAPLPPSFLNYIQSRASLRLDRVMEDEDKDKDDDKPHLPRSFGDSAAVATGMALEELLTASLLPLAGLHVLRCRALEEMVHPVERDDGDEGVAVAVGGGIAGVAAAAGDGVPSTSFPNTLYTRYKKLRHPVTGEIIEMDMKRLKWNEETPWEEWTLPPEEAIMKLLEQGLLAEGVCHLVPEPSRSLLRSTTPSATSAVTAATVNTTNAAAAVGRATTVMPRKGNNQKPIFDGGEMGGNNKAGQESQLWGRRFNIDPKVVATNKEIVRIFATPRR